MMLAFDEEVDYLEYQNYLKLQSDSELYDIVAHLNYSNRPRRAEAARRELYRRDTFQLCAYPESDVLWRNFALMAILVTVLTLILGVTMSQEEAISPQPPPSLDLTADGNFFQFSSSNDAESSDGLSSAVLGVYVAQLGENLLREAVQISSRSGLYLAMVIITFWKLIEVYGRRRMEDPLTRDIRRLTAIAATGEALLLLVCALSHLPRLVECCPMTNSGFLIRAIALIAPWS